MAAVETRVSPRVALRQRTRLRDKCLAVVVQRAAGIDLPLLARAVVERSGLTPPEHPVRMIERGSIPPVEVDPVRVEQVLSNLLSNAAKYGYPNTEILVEMERQDGYVHVGNQRGL